MSQHSATASGKPAVLIVVQNLPVPFDRRVWLEATTLQSHGYRVTVISPTGQHGHFQKRHEVLAGVEIRRYPAPPDGQTTISYFYEFLYCWLWTFWLAWQTWRKNQFSILHICNPPETYFALAWFYRWQGVRILFDHHDLSPDVYLAKGGKENGWLHRGLLLLERLMLNSAHHIITTNATQRRIARERANLPADKFTIVRSGPRYETLYPVEPQPELKQGSTYLLAYLGEIGSHDGVENVLYIAQYIRQKRDDVHVAILGGGQALDDVKALSHRLGLDDMVTFTGRVFDDDIRRYLSTADICVIPDPITPYAHTASMNKVMEYMVFGKPVVGFALHENQVSAQKAGLFVASNQVEALASEVLNLLKDPTRRQQMGAAAQERAQSRLLWDYSIPHLLNAYEKVKDDQCVS